ncbi:MAG: hypothetical protein HYY77_07925 [Betaproteobacteria bacterium]|nr:hypothetical protein [Betaproteobacteria bacterium]
MNRVGDTLLHVGANEELIRAFTSGGVEFVVVGGLAVAWYCSDRQADDMDLLVNPTLENSARISRALDSLRMHGYSDRSFTKPGLQVPLKQVHYAELLTPQRDGPAYAEVAKDAVDARLFNIPVRVASAAALIRLKEQAVASAETQKDKHVMDIKRLKKNAV